MSASRRTFLATTAASAATLVVGARRGRAAESKDLRLAVIGLNGQGDSHLRAMGPQVTALCDVDQQVLTRRAEQLRSETGRQPETYVDYRDLLANSDVDAVSIATPNHTHALIAIAAIQAGKDVYVEKPASHNVWEGRQMVLAARLHDRIVQCGTQGRSDASNRRAVQFVRNGALGKVRYAVGTCYKPRKSIGRSETPLQFPKFVHRDLWLGPAADEAIYRPEKNSVGGYGPHYDWHWDFATGNGDMGNQGVHQMDVARWFLGAAELPRRVVSVGGRLGYQDAGNTPNTQVVYFDFGAAPLLFETRGLPRSRVAQSEWDRSMDNYRGARVGVVVQCEGGYVVVSDSARAYDRQGKEITIPPLPDGDAEENHFANWLQAVAARDSSRLHADVLEGHLSSALCHLGQISHQLGQTTPYAEIVAQAQADELLANSLDRMAGHLRANEVDVDAAPGALTQGRWLDLDPAAEQIRGDDQANARLSREYREPFIVQAVG